MPVESAADRAAYLSADEFAATGVYTPAAGGGGVSIDGIFDSPSVDVAMPDADVTDASPTFFCRTADLPSGAAGDAGDVLAIGVDTFKVAELRPDAQGMTMVILSR